VVFGTLPAQALRKGQVGIYNKPRSLSKTTIRMTTTRRPIIPGTFASFVGLFSYLLMANHTEEKTEAPALYFVPSHLMGCRFEPFSARFFLRHM
jgi:hypothetical protein